MRSSDALVDEKRIELRNFGVFEVKKRAARKARNPRTGQRVDVPEKYVVTFKPGKEMEERVRQLEREAAEAAVRARAAPDRLRGSAEVEAGAAATSSSTTSIGTPQV
jgi:integration host factor subunit beta